MIPSHPHAFTIHAMCVHGRNNFSGYCGLCLADHRLRMFNLGRRSAELHMRKVLRLLADIPRKDP